MSNSFLAVVILFSLVAAGTAQSLSGKLVQIDSGASSASTTLTNGAVFKVGGSTYRLEMESPAGADLNDILSRKGMPIRLVDLPSKDAFTMLTHLSGVTIVCGPGVNKDIEVSINSQEDSIMSVIEQICFQINAEATVRKGTVWITPLPE
ncbi:hypothetical protein P4E94_06565 [Pontiellaceae bacterium B12219]|nr:hypothetical protein [Pontiellaceae bacterium B12219]